MDRERPKSGQSSERGPSVRSSPDLLAQPLLPSRQRAYSILREAVEMSRGPIVIGGGAGVGKTWLWRRLEAESPVGREWISVTVSPEMKASDLLILIAFHIGARTPSLSNPALGLLRASILDRLSDLETQGVEVVLTVEDAQLLEPNAREELTALVNDAGLGSGLRALVLVGRMFPQPRRPLSDAGGIESRLHARVQLGPIDADEALTWLRAHYPRHDWSEREVEILHRDARGIPGVLDRLALTVPAGRPRVEVHAAQAVATPPPLVRTEAPPQVAAPRPVAVEPPASLVGPSKPPIRFEENAVEVGWVSDDPSQEDVFAASAPRQVSGDIIKEVGPNVPPLVIRPSSPIHAWPSDSLDEADPGQAMILNEQPSSVQAWDDWTKKQAAGVSRAGGAGNPDATPPLDPTPSFSRREGTQEVWAETEQEFAPYGPIFHRAKPMREP